jgi:hypothetical protein
MNRADLPTDGNAIAGVLQEIFAMEMTAAERACQSCGARNAVGAHRLYEGAGYVLRCPRCGDIAASVVTIAEGYAVSMHGTWLLGRAVTRP